jgi:replication factor C subunit 2/4
MTSQLPWIEKYRPINLKDIILNKTIKFELDTIIKNKELNNLIITGIPGIGKTTTIKVLANELYGPYINDYVLEINASDDRGIKIKDNLINFCNRLIFYKKKDKDKYAQHKLIILDETDNITIKAQKVISSIMDKYNDKTKFIFTCNSSDKILTSIQSKSRIIRYPKVNNALIFNRLKFICDTEHIIFDDNALEFIIELCNGDIRAAINILNITYNNHKQISKHYILEMYDKPHPDTIKSIILAYINSDMKSYICLILDLKKKGFCYKDISINMFNILKSNLCNDIDIHKKIKFAEKLTITICNITKGIDSLLQFL